MDEFPFRLPPIRGAQDYSHLRGSVVERRSLQREHKRHLARLTRVKPSIDNGPPPMYRHMRHNAKKALMVDERYETIERQNRQLLDKLQHIMLADNGTLAPAAAGPGGAAAVRRVGPVSLNEQLRRHEQRRLTRENESIVRRIMLQKPVYSAHKLEEDYKRNRYYAGQLPASLATTGDSRREPGGILNAVAAWRGVRAQDGAASQPELLRLRGPHARPVADDGDGGEDGARGSGRGRGRGGRGGRGGASRRAAAADGRGVSGAGVGGASSADRALSLADLSDMSLSANAALPPTLAQVGLLLLHVAAKEAGATTLEGLPLDALADTFQERTTGLTADEMAAVWDAATARNMSAAEAALFLEDAIAAAISHDGGPGAGALGDDGEDEITIELPSGTVAYSRAALLAEAGERAEDAALAQADAEAAEAADAARAHRDREAAASVLVPAAAIAAVPEPTAAPAGALAAELAADSTVAEGGAEGGEPAPTGAEGTRARAVLAADADANAEGEGKAGHLGGAADKPAETRVEARAAQPEGEADVGTLVLAADEPAAGEAPVEAHAPRAQPGDAAVALGTSDSGEAATATATVTASESEADQTD
ncbi:hypothetical protein KFE25_011179 [Diacronema lutheri]|uniref:Uncharacterized protein n=1 Tax=Diacronema lutheri TaxID=2081491 RepID=A0A8J5XFZ6_DIALT|nr:hypothetical protein KFE25_011179 [Diacronema lutheri]